MRVKIGHTWFDSKDQPIALELSPEERKQISAMTEEAAPNGRYSIVDPNHLDSCDEELTHEEKLDFYRSWLSDDIHSELDNTLTPDNTEFMNHLSSEVGHVVNVMSNPKALDNNGNSLSALWLHPIRVGVNAVPGESTYRMQIITREIARQLRIRKLSLTHLYKIQYWIDDLAIHCNDELIESLTVYVNVCGAVRPIQGEGE